MSNIVNPHVEVSFGDKKFKAHFPNIGQYIDIEGLKQSITNGRYALMSVSPLNSTQEALNLVDSVAYFSVLLGDPFFKAFGVKSAAELLDLPIDKSKGIIDAYLNDFAPFYNKIAKRDDRQETPADDQESGTKKETDE